MNGHADFFKYFNYALKEAIDAKLVEKEEKYQRIYFQERMDKTVLRLSTLDSSTYSNMQRVLDEHNEALSVAKDKGKIENIEELDKLSQTLEEKM